jgi:hypothetical protein
MNHLMIFLLSFIIVGIWLYWGNTTIKTTKINIQSNGLPIAFDHFVVVHISDLHNAEFGKQQKRLLHTIAASNPDIITITGDLIDSRRTDTRKALTFMEGAVKIAPVYFVAGNHESRIAAYPMFQGALTDAGVTVLKNESAFLQRHGSRIRLFGLEDPTFHPDHNVLRNKKIIDKILRNAEKEDDLYTILLSHRPELFDVYADHGIDLALCGHAHGGQVRLPFIGGLYAPNQGLLPKYQNGLYTKGRTNMVVSRGLGNSLDPIRVCNRPEVVAITLHTQSQKSTSFPKK